MTKKITLYFLIFWGIGIGSLCAQQDPMFTKYMFNSQVFNPAYAGSKEYFSANILMREQWWGLTSTAPNGDSFKYSPSTQTLAIQSPIGKRISLGLTLIKDRIGVRNSTTANFVYAYHFPFAKGELSIGVQGGLINWRSDWTKLNFKDPQFLDPIYADPNPTRMVPNVGVGLYYYSDKFYAGFSIPHLIENDLRDLSSDDLSISRNTDRFYRHYYFMTGAAIELIGKSLVFKPSILIKNVGLLSDYAANQQTLTQISAPTEFDIDLSLLFNEVFWIGVAYRSAFEIEAFGGPSSNDSADIWFSVMLGNGLRIGAAYDFTLTDLRRSTSGSFELMLGYDLDFRVRKVNTPRYF
jgi:type IX secretion system PorP/SprF family membrane protein